MERVSTIQGGAGFLLSTVWLHQALYLVRHRLAIKSWDFMLRFQGTKHEEDGLSENKQGALEMPMADNIIIPAIEHIPESWK